MYSYSLLGQAHVKCFAQDQPSMDYDPDGSRTYFKHSQRNVNSQSTTCDKQNGVADQDNYQDTAVGTELETDRISVSSSELPNTYNVEEFAGNSTGVHKSDLDKIKLQIGTNDRIFETANKVL